MQSTIAAPTDVIPFTGRDRGRGREVMREEGETDREKERGRACARTRQQPYRDTEFIKVLHIDANWIPYPADQTLRQRTQPYAYIS